VNCECRRRLHGSFQGNGTGVQIHARQSTVADRSRIDCGVHRPRRTVRKLRAPDYDLVDLAVGWIGGAHRIDAVSSRTERDLAYRASSC